MVNEILDQLYAAGVTDAQIIAAAGFMSVFMLVFLIISFSGLILYVVGQWKIFSKAGEKGWKALIPFYNLYTQYEISWNKLMIVPFVICTLIGAFVAGSTEGFASVLSLLSGLVTAYIAVMSAYKLAKSFGKGVGFAIGLILLNPLFMFILGVGKAQYLGPNGDTLKYAE